MSRRTRPDSDGHSPGTTPSEEIRVRAAFDGDPLEAAPGASVAAALIASGRPAWRDTRDNTQRGLFCGIGVCFDCIVEIDGESGQRACMIPLRDGMDIRRTRGPLGSDETHAAGPHVADAVSDPDAPTGLRAVDSETDA